MSRKLYYLSYLTTIHERRTQSARHVKPLNVRTNQEPRLLVVPSCQISLHRPPSLASITSKLSGYGEKQYNDTPARFRSTWYHHHQDNHIKAQKQTRKFREQGTNSKDFQTGGPNWQTSQTATQPDQEDQQPHHQYQQTNQDNYNSATIRHFPRQRRFHRQTQIKWTQS